MTTPFDTPQPASAANKPLWAAVGVLGVAVLAMGITLIRLQTRPEEPRLTALSASAPAPLIAASAVPASLPTVAPVAVVAPEVTPIAEKTPKIMPNKAEVHVQRTQTATKSVAQKNPKQLDATAPALPAINSAAVNPPPVVMPAPKPICVNCGTVTSVTPIQRDGVGGGGGVLAGGVLGAVVGNQIGDGGGKALATLLGAVGGGLAGNAVEKRMKKETVYEVRVQMEDGSTHTMEQSTPASVGAKVFVDGNTLQPASR